MCSWHPCERVPVKESRTSKVVCYFEAMLTDGKKSARVLSFDVAHFEAMKKAEAEQAVVVLNNSTVKKSSFSSQPEFHLNKTSKVDVSPRKFSLGAGEAVLTLPSGKAHTSCGEDC